MPLFLLMKMLLRLAFSWVGVIAIALCGVWLMGRAVLDTITKGEESEPTAVTLADFRPERPKKEWLTVSGGVVYWPEAMTMVEERKTRGGAKLSSKEEAIYIPLVSPEVRDEWVELTALRGDTAPLDYSKCDVLLVVRPDATPADFPKNPSKLVKPSYEQLVPDYTPTGRAMPPDSLDATARREIARVTPQIDLTRVTVVEVGGRPPSSADRGMLVVFGLLLLVPCALKAVLGAKLSNWLYPDEVDDGTRPTV